jgi:hypothetical protein
MFSSLVERPGAERLLHAARSKLHAMQSDSRRVAAASETRTTASGAIHASNSVATVR